MLGTHAWHACLTRMLGTRASHADRQQATGAARSRTRRDDDGQQEMRLRRQGVEAKSVLRALSPSRKCHDAGPQCQPCPALSTPCLLCFLYALPSLLPLRPRFSTCSLLYKRSRDNSKTPTRPTNQIKHHHAAGASLSKGRRAWGAAERLLTHVSWHMAAGT
jgi:hypothetical protein